MSRRGLPGQLEIEAEAALRPIFLKYVNMKKKHMSRDRIVGIMYGAFLSLVRAPIGHQAQPLLKDLEALKEEEVDDG